MLTWILHDTGSDRLELLAERGLRADHVKGVEVGATLRPGTGATFAPETRADQRQLARGIDHELSGEPEEDSPGHE